MTVDVLLLKGKLKEAKAIAEMLEGEDKDIALAKVFAFEQRWGAIVKRFYPKINKNTKDEMRRLVAYAFFNTGGYKKSYELFSSIKNKTADDLFMLSVLATLLGEADKARKFLEKAISKDRDRVKELMRFFYDIFIKPHDEFTPKEKQRLLKILSSE